jgi:uncharacterized membrane protein YdjX (TVP38/TMEM64 family)
MSRRLIVSLSVLAVAIAAAMTAWHVVDIPATVAAAQRWKAESPFEVAICAVSLFSLWACALPTTVLELTIGYIFGLWEGWAIDFAAKLISSIISYWLGRIVLRTWLHGLWLSSGKQQVLLAFECEVAERPYWTAFLVRVAYVPMAVKNYGMALIGVPPLAFCAILFPVEFADSYLPVALGSGAKDLQDLFSGRADSAQLVRTWTQLGVLGLEVVILGVLAMHLARLAARAIERKDWRGGDGASSGTQVLV